MPDYSSIRISVRVERTLGSDLMRLVTMSLSISIVSALTFVIMS
jgi:hypothetical protein